MSDQRNFPSALIQYVAQLGRCVNDQFFKVTIACERDLTAVSRAIFKCLMILFVFLGAPLPAQKEQIVPPLCPQTVCRTLRVLQLTI